MAGSSGGRTAKDLVFMQLMVRPNFLQHVERESSIAVRSTSCWPEEPCHQLTPGQSLTSPALESFCSRLDQHQAGRPP